MRHDLLDALRTAYPDFAGTVHAGGYGTDRVDFDVDGRAYTVLTIRLDDDGGFRNVLMASLGRLRRPGRCSSCPSATTRPRPTRTTGATSPGARQRPHCSTGRRSSPSGGSSRPGRASGRRSTSSRSSSPARAAARSRCSAGDVSSARADAAPVLGRRLVRGQLRRQEPLRVQHRRAARHRVDAHVRGHLRPRHEHGRTSTLVGGSTPANDLHYTPGICMDSAGTCTS